VEQSYITHSLTCIMEFSDASRHVTFRLASCERSGGKILYGRNMDPALFQKLDIGSIFAVSEYEKNRGTGDTNSAVNGGLFTQVYGELSR
jgi:hypothetical protein